MINLVQKTGYLSLDTTTTTTNELAPERRWRVADGQGGMIARWCLNELSRSLTITLLLLDTNSGKTHYWQLVNLILILLFLLL